MEIEVTFLGTGTSQGVPMIGCQCEVCTSKDPKDRRLRSSVLVSVDGINIMIDTTPDFRYQMLRAGITQLDAVLYTHEHKDHTGGMDDIRAFNYLTKRPVEIYCEPRVEKILRKDYDYAFASDRYPGVPEIKINTIREEPFEIRGVKIIPIRGHHHNLPVLGFRIGTFCYLTDMNSIDESQIDKLVGLDVLVINALRRKSHISHFTLEQALDLIQIIQPRRAYLTHISHQLGLYEEVSATLPDNVELAYDKLQIKITTFVE